MESVYSEDLLQNTPIDRQKAHIEGTAPFAFAFT
jgi:hypothetical protein